MFNTSNNLKINESFNKIFTMQNNYFNNDNWTRVYSTNFLPVNQGKSVDKMNIIIKTNTGSKVNIIIDYDKTLKDLIKIYFERIGRLELLHSNSIYFLYQTKNWIFIVIQK